MKKRVLVYPCGTEIGLEIYRAVNKSIHFELIGGSSTYDHGRFVYENHIDGLPFITDSSSGKEIEKFNKILMGHNIDFIYPAMDGVLLKFAEFRELLGQILIAPSTETATITRSKRNTYDVLKNSIIVPEMYEHDEPNLQFPLFLKPDVGQGSKNTRIIKNKNEYKIYSTSNLNEMLLLEYLPGQEYTIDCFTNSNGKLIYAGGRTRRRIKDGISVNAIEENNFELLEIAKTINSKIQQKGGWFFQVRRNKEEMFSLLEVACRIAGTSSFTRNMGINLPLLTLHLYNGNDIDNVIKNSYTLELDRALYNKFKSNIKYNRVYIDYDDTIVVNNKINIQLIAFIYQCINDNIPVILITKHNGDIKNELAERKLLHLFDEIIHVPVDGEKHVLIKGKDSIFIDDSYGERLKIHKKKGINVFDIHMIECLMKDCC